MSYEQPSLEEAINYIAEFGGYDKAWILRGRSRFSSYKEYYYHKECLMVFVDWFGGE